MRSLKPHEEALGRSTSQHSQLRPVLKPWQPRSRHMSEDSFHWFQPLATWLLSPVWEGSHCTLLHCTALEFLTHRIYESDKINIILCHYVYGGLLKRVDNQNTGFYWSNLEFYLWVIIIFKALSLLFKFFLIFNIAHDTSKIRFVNFTKPFVHTNF